MPPDGIGNITNEPAFVDLAAADFRLRFGSPCIDAGTNLSAIVTNDLDGNARPLDGNGDGVAAFDMGAYEYNPQTADDDGDGMTTFQEWVADTDPTNAASCLRIAAASNGPPAAVFFESSSNRLYTLFACTNLAGTGWTSVPGQANVPGTGGSQVLQDTNAPSTRFYRVGELDEEMVFESRLGDVFLLGASSWRIEDITHDRVLVSPAPGVPGKMPFWHGDRPGRRAAFGRAIGELAR